MVDLKIRLNIQVCHWCPGGPSIRRESICVIFQKKNRHIVWSFWLIHFPFLLIFLLPLSRTLITSIKLSALPFVTSLETSTRQHVLANLARTRSSSFSWVCDIPTNFCIDPDIYFDSLVMVWFCLPLKKVNKLSTKSNLGEDLANSVFWNFVMSLTFLKWKMLISLIRKKAIHWGFYFCSKIIIQNPKHFNYSNRN